LAAEKLSRLQDGLSSRRSRGYHKPEARDLVLVRDFRLVKEHGRKLHAQWTTPRLLERISHSGVSGHVRQLHDPQGRTKRFPLDDLLLYVQRDSNYPRGPVESSGRAVEYMRGAMGEVQGVQSVDQRAFDMGDMSLEAGDSSRRGFR